MDLKTKIKELCKRKGVSMNALENELGFAKGYISKLGNGGSIPNALKLQKIADYFGVTVDYLMTGDDKENKYYLNDETASIAQDIFEHKELRLLFDAAKDAAPEDIQAAHNVLLALKRKEQKND